jgi:uncharacterized protein (TIGR03086 family)
MDVITLFERSLRRWTSLVSGLDHEQWSLPTPCTEWTVRELVNHVVAEERWAAPLLERRTIAEVGSRFDGDLLGADPIGSASQAAAAARQAVAEQVPAGGQVHLSYGDEYVDEYIRQLALDHLVHAWDLAAATSRDAALDADLLAEAETWLSANAEMLLASGLFGQPQPATGDRLGNLLAATGRRIDWSAADAALSRFSAAFGSGDVDRIMTLMTEDCVFESTSPPDGQRYEGAAAVRAAWDDLFASTPGAAFVEEERFASGDRGVLHWRFHWADEDGGTGHVRGVDVLTFRAGKVSRKLSYVKG